MNYLTEDLYKKMQLFQFPMEGDMTLKQLAEEFELDLDEFLLQELMAHDEWYDRYLPKKLHDRLFDVHGEVTFQELDDTILDGIAAFRRETEQQWAAAMANVQREKQMLWNTATPALRALLQMHLEDSEIQRISGIDTDTVVVQLYPAWNIRNRVSLKFTQVKNSWMTRMHRDDANWWLVDEITADEEIPGRYVLHGLIGNADNIGKIQFSFADVEVTEQETGADV